MSMPFRFVDENEYTQEITTYKMTATHSPILWLWIRDNYVMLEE